MGCSLCGALVPQQVWSSCCSIDEAFVPPPRVIQFLARPAATHHHTHTHTHVHACRAKPKTSNALASFLASCPDNAFQKVPPGMEPFTGAQRLGAILRNGSKLLGVGFCASMIGEGVCAHACAQKRPIKRAAGEGGAVRGQ